MKSRFALLVALTIFASACSSFQNQSDVAANDLGVRDTPWGKLREYSFRGLSPDRESLLVYSTGVNGTTVVDLLVGADGVVKDATIVESSGDAKADLAARADFSKRTFPAMRGPDGESSYVMRMKMTFEDGSLRQEHRAASQQWPVALNPMPTAPTLPGSR